MSEYQYSEFRAIDRVLTDRQMRELRAISTRAVISRTSFSNHYTFGDLKANPRDLLVKYFDASLYFANWLFLEVAFRYPKSALDLKMLRRYAAGPTVDVRSTGPDVVVAISVESDGDSFDTADDATGWLAWTRGHVREAHPGVATGAHEEAEFARTPSEGRPLTATDLDRRNYSVGQVHRIRTVTGGAHNCGQVSRSRWW